MDKELVAIQQIMKALEPFNWQVRKRIINYVEDKIQPMYNIPPIGSILSSPVFMKEDDGLS